MIKKILKSLKRGFSKTINYLKEVRFEMKKVSWPTKREALRYTLIVIFVALIVATFLGALDFLLITLLDKFVL